MPREVRWDAGRPMPGGTGLTLSVAVLGLPLSARVWGGISWATYRLMENITRTFPDTPFHLVMYEEPGTGFARSTVDDLVSSRDNLDLVVTARGRESISWCEDHSDVVWGPSSGILRTGRVPQVVTHHDMRMFGRFKESWSHALTHRAGLNHAMKRAKAAVMISETTRAETLAHYRGRGYEAKTCTVHWGVPEGFEDAEGVEPLRPGSVGGEHFITAVYDPFPHKRMDLLGRVTPLLDEHGWDLVVIGGMRGGGVDVRVDHPRVHYPGFVDHGTMPRYIKASSLFLHPSEYEGFGHPPYEAMALGVPVLYNRRCQALASIIGDRTFSFSTDEELPRALDHLMGSEVDRVQHVEGARALVARFDWEVTARRYMYVFQRVREYGDRPLDFAASDPEPPAEAVPDPGPWG